MANPSASESVSPWDLFRTLLPPQLLNDLDPKALQTVYTPYVVTWLMLFQRLHGNATLNDAVSELICRFPQPHLSQQQAARQSNLSANSGAYSLARTSLDARVLYWAADNAYDTLVENYPPSWRDRRAYILDGTTVQLAPSVPLRHAFPPASNQHGSSHWPILHLAVAHELASGLAVFPEYGAMYGPQARSELSLARALLARLPKQSLLLGDRNFGVFAFAWAASEAEHDVLLRLTSPRFESLCKKASQVGEGKWELTWRPSKYDCKSHPDMPQDASVQGWLLEVKVSEKITLWLFTTVEMTKEEAAGLYHQRQHVESDIKDIKITLKLGEMTSKSVAMVEKELTAAMLAYNLVNQVRRLAGERLQVEARRLSFSGVWSLLKAFAQSLMADSSAEEAAAAFERLLKAAGQRKLPHRQKDRRYSREVIARRRKFPTRKRAEKTADK